MKCMICAENKEKITTFGYCESCIKTYSIKGCVKIEEKDARLRVINVLTKK